jgi:NADPH:quinone reductase-like Zn-dependent oxidoreductase
MKAAVYEVYGPPEVVTIREVPKPVPKHDEVLIRVHAATVSAADWRIRSRNVPTGFGFIMRLLFGWSKPKRPILGTDAAGVIAEVGKAVTRFSAGQAVIALTGMHMGCHAEYVCVREDSAIVPKPDGLSFDEAVAMCFGGTTALHFFREAKLQAGERLLVNGAAGAVGSAAIQLAKHAGAHVTAVCSTANVELVRSLGADEIIDYTQQDFARSGSRYDLIMDNVGTAPFSRCAGMLSAGGRLLLVVGDLPAALQAPWIGLTTDKRVIAGSAPERAEDLRQLAQLAADLHIKPLIGARYPLAQIVEAHRLVDSGHKRGNVVITFAS